MLFGAHAARTDTEPDDYVDVELRLFPSVGGETPVELRLSQGRDFPASRIRLDLAALAALETRPQAYGEALGRLLFDGTTLGTQFSELVIALDAKAQRSRWRLRVDDLALETIQWERLCYPEQGQWVPMAANAARPFSRFVATDWKSSLPLTQRPISMLMVHASPRGLNRVQLADIPDAERQALRDALLEREAAAQVSCVSLSSASADRPTLDRVRQAMTEAPSIVHFLCHGVRGPEGSALVLEGDDGAARVVGLAEILDAIRGATTPPRLIVLSACESASHDGTAAFVALGPALSASGIDAVLAMSGPVSMDTARRFCAHFYERLFAHGVVDRAVCEARAVVRGALDWGVPVLFSRLRDGQLLEFPSAVVDTAYLSISERAVRSALTARSAAERSHEARSQAADDMIGATTALISQLEGSHKVLVGVCSDFRATGSSPAEFATRFENFRVEFKRYFDEKGWHAERTRCHELRGPADHAMALFQQVLPSDQLLQLKEDLATLQQADGMIVQHLEAFLNEMDAAVEAIARLIPNDLAAAIEAKLAFEDQISPTFRRSKSLLADIAERSHRVRKA